MMKSSVTRGFPIQRLRFGTSDLKLTANLKNNVIEPKLTTRNPASNVTYSRTVPPADTSELVVGKWRGLAHGRPRKHAYDVIR